MYKAISDYISILTDNEYKIYSREIPDDFDHKDELLAELNEIISDGGTLPDSMRDFEINGFSSPVDLEDFMAKLFAEFKIVFLGHDKDSIRNEIVNQLDDIGKDLDHLNKAVVPLNDLTLNELLKIKSNYYNQTVEFLKEGQATSAKKESGSEQSKQPKPPKPEPQYYFTIRKEFYRDGNDILQRLYAKLLSRGYLECTESEFKKLFYFESEQGTRKTPKSVIWKTGTYNELAYFIKCLMEDLFTKSNKPPRYASGVMLFHNNQNGVLFKNIETDKLQYDNNLRKDGRDTIESIIEKSISPTH